MRQAAKRCKVLVDPALRVIAAATVPLSVGAPQYVPVHVGAHLSPLLTTCFLIEAEMDSAVDTRVADVVGDLLEGLILQDHARNRRIAQGNEMVTRPIESLEYFASRIAQAAVRRPITRKAWGDDVWLPGRVAARVDRRFRPPEVIKILRVEHRR